MRSTLVGRRGDVHRDHLGARHHHVAAALVGQLEDGADELRRALCPPSRWRPGRRAASPAPPAAAAAARSEPDAEGSEQQIHPGEEHAGKGSAARREQRGQPGQPERGDLRVGAGDGPRASRPSRWRAGPRRARPRSGAASAPPDAARAGTRRTAASRGGARAPMPAARKPLSTMPEAQRGGRRLALGAQPEHTSAGPPGLGGQLLGFQLGNARERRLRRGHEGADEQEGDAPGPQRPGRHLGTVTTPDPTVLSDSLTTR